jgi:hypothetical protein
LYPILVIGAGANRKMTAKVLKQLIDQTGILRRMTSFSTVRLKGEARWFEPL